MPEFLTRRELLAVAGAAPIAIAGARAEAQQLKPLKSFTHRADGIDWYCEQRGQGPHVVLVPSGEGDCASFEQTAASLAADFTVLTFDMPGFSRTSRPADSEISMYKLGDQIAALARSLGLGRATYYGCSSGGVAVLDLVRHHRDLVRNALVHEAAITDLSSSDGKPWPILRLLKGDDRAIIEACKVYFDTVANENSAAWRALGPAYHARLERNYVTWVRQYLAKLDPAWRVDPAELAGRPLSWSVGGLSPVERAISNIRLALAAGVDLRLLPSRHFPQVSAPAKLAEHIRARTAPFI